MSPRRAALLVTAALAAGVLAGCASTEPAATAPESASVAAMTPAAASAEPAASGDSGVPVPSMAPAAKIPAAERPTRISIPSIGVDSSLTDLGLAADGSLEVPADFQQAGWLDRSAAPGAQGPAVIAGHVDSKSGPAVFYRLRELKPGARIAVTTAGGAKVTFSVDGVQQYAKKKFPTAAVYGPVPGPVLRLITCGGAFDAKAGHYRDNVVVYAS